MASSPATPAAARLRAYVQDAVAVVAHRGDSGNCPENTLPAFAAAVQLGVAAIEFDVQATADGELVCLHDDELDRTTDAARVLGPGTRVRDVDRSRLGRLDAGAWKAAAFQGTRVPLLGEALGTMLPRVLPMIEHKGGTAAAYVELLRRLGCVRDVLLQSFDWEFVAAARAAAPELVVGLLGPHADGARPGDDVFHAAARVGAAFVHWDAAALRAEDVDRIHAAGLLCVTYTTDDEPGWRAGAALGIDAMCTNVPASMLAARATGALARRRTGS